jgi:hypothetical protein
LQEKGFAEKNARMTVPAAVEKFRVEYRATQIGPRYSGRLHFATTLSVTGAVVIACLATLRDVRAIEWLTIPIAFVLANIVEYLAHRFVMHHPRPGLRIVYERQTVTHHHFYTHDAMAAESTRDFHMVLFPPVLLFFFLGLIDAPLATLVYLGLGLNVAKLFVAVTVGYYFAYECFHTIYHLPDGHWAPRLPGMRTLAKLHTSHHALAQMGFYNFNITIPLGDAIFRTYKRD